MILGTKNEEAFFLFVPIGAYTAENGCAVVECMRCHPDLCLGVGNDFALEIRVLR